MQEEAVIFSALLSLWSCTWDEDGLAREPALAKVVRLGAPALIEIHLPDRMSGISHLCGMSLSYKIRMLLDLTLDGSLYLRDSMNKSLVPRQSIEIRVGRGLTHVMGVHL